MTSRILIVAIAAIIWSLPALGAGSFVYVPTFVPPPSVPSAETGELSKIHTVAIISAIGEHLTLSYTGFWGTKSKEFDIKSWNLDDFTVANARKLLADRFSFKDVAYDRAPLAAIPNGVFNNSSAALRKYLSALPNDGIDAFLVVRPDSEYGAAPIEGVGIQAGGGMLGDDVPPIAWVNFEIDIVDAHTLKTIAKAASRAQLREGQPPAFAGFVLDKTFNPSQELEFSSDQMTGFHDRFEYFTNIALTETFRSLDLGAALPTPGERAILPVPPADDPYRSIKTVAVVSAIGDQLEFEHLGIAAFSSTQTRVPMPDWNLDRQVEQLVKDAVSRRFTVKDIPIDRTKLYDVRLLDGGGAWRSTLSEIAPSPDVDAYIVVVKHPLRLFANDFGGVTDGTGVGVWRFVAGEQDDVYTFYAIALVDARTLRILDGHAGVLPPTFPSELAMQKVDGSYWPDKPESPDPVVLTKIHAQVNALLSASIPETLLHMLLTGQVATHEMASPAHP